MLLLQGEGEGEGEGGQFQPSPCGPSVPAPSATSWTCLSISSSSSRSSAPKRRSFNFVIASALHRPQEWPLPGLLGPLMGLSDVSYYPTWPSDSVNNLPINLNLSAFASLIVKAAPLVALIGGFVCFLSLSWACFGRGDGEAQFGGITERTQYLLTYLHSERFAYAFIWDILLYSIFQPWLIADNIQNVQTDRVPIVTSFKFIPVMGLLFYLFSLALDENTL